MPTKEDLYKFKELIQKSFPTQAERLQNPPTHFHITKIEEFEEIRTFMEEKGITRDFLNEAAILDDNNFVDINKINQNWLSLMERKQMLESPSSVQR